MAADGGGRALPYPIPAAPHHLGLRGRKDEHSLPGNIYGARRLARGWRNAGRGGVWRGAHSAMSQARALPQSKETLLQSYNKRLRDDVKSIMDNFTEIIKTAKVRLGSAGVAAREAGSLAPAAAGLLHC